MRRSPEHDEQRPEEQQPEESWRDFLDISNPRAQRDFAAWVGSSVLISATGVGVAASLAAGLATTVGLDRWHSHSQRQQAE